MQSKSTICFSTFCKNNGNTLLNTLKNVYKYIDYWVINDIGSTDNTCDIIINFFEDKKINGILLKEVNNKTTLFEKCYKKTDFLLFLDLYDDLVGDYSFNTICHNKNIGYYVRTFNNNIINSKCVLYNNHYVWKHLGKTESISKCIDNKKRLNFEYLKNENIVLIKHEIHYDNTDILIKQYQDTIVNDEDNINTYYLFLIPDKFFDLNKYNEALFWFSLYSKNINTEPEKLFVCYLKSLICSIKLDLDISIILKYAINAITIQPERAEPFYIMGEYYMYQNNYILAYYNLKKAKSKIYKTILDKYNLFINKYQYEIYINKILAYVCFNNDKIDEGIELLNELINKKDIIPESNYVSKDTYLLLENLLSCKEDNKKIYNNIYFYNLI